MKADKQSRLTPKLRFPEFRDAPDWSASRGDRLFDSINNRNAEPGLPVLAITQEHGAIPRDQIDYHVSVTPESVAGYKEVCEGDFIISLRSFQGGIEYSRYHGICSPAYVILRRKANGSDQFFRHLFKSDRFIQQLTRNIEGIRDGKMISYTQFSEQLLPIPEISEQQKIADCLGSLDALIAAEGEKLEALRQHKQGLMQQLFPQPGETVPRLRFPEFEDAPEWSQVALGEIATFASGGTPSKDVPEYWNGHIPWISASSMYDTNIRDSERKVTALAIGNGTRIAKAGSLLILTRGSMLYNRVPIGIASIDVAFNQDVRALTIDTTVNTSFLMRQLIAQESRIPINDTGIGAGKIDTDDLRRLPVAFPSLSEQQKIASSLSALDDRIAAQARRIEALKTHKQGLLQQLFPSPEGNE